MLKQRGETLISLLSGIAVALIVSGAALAVYSASSRNAADTVKGQRLIAYGQGLSEIISREVRRAGYGAPATPVKAYGSCVFYSYDPGSGVMVGGFRVNTSNGTLEQFVQPSPALSMSAISACSDGQWQAINNTQGMDAVFVNSTTAFTLDTATRIMTIRLSLGARQDQSQQVNYTTQVFLTNL